MAWSISSRASILVVSVIAFVLLRRGRIAHFRFGGIAGPCPDLPLARPGREWRSRCRRSPWLASRTRWPLAIPPPATEIAKVIDAYVRVYQTAELDGLG